MAATPWKNARTFDQLCELMALWLEGRIPTRAAYAPGYGPEEETTALVPTLAACCRAGFLTDCSQPGTPDKGQRPAVHGFIRDRALLTRLRLAALSQGLIVIVDGTTTGRDIGCPVLVTLDRGKPFTWFGAPLKRKDLLYLWDDLARPVAGQLVAAHQVAVIDPNFGPGDRLWHLLDQITGRTR